MSKEKMEAEMEVVTERIQARAVGNQKDRSDQLTFGDRCYLSGLGFAVGTITGETRDEVMSRVQSTVLPPKKRVIKKPVKKRFVVRRKK